MRTKSELAAAVAAGLGRESFEHSEEGIFDITALREIAPKVGVRLTVGLWQILPHLATSREVCMNRVRELPEASWRNDPAIFLVFTNGDEETHLMVDGHHRAQRRHLEGLEDLPAYFVPATLAPRPPPGWGRRADLDWGEKEMVNGKLVPRGK